MRSSRQGAIPSDLGWLVDELDGFADRLRTLEAPSGEALGSTVAKLTALVANIQAQLDAYNASRYTNAQIDAAISNAIAAALAGNVTIGGTLNVGRVTTSDLFVSLSAFSTVIGATRAAVWVDNAGRIGRT